MSELRHDALSGRDVIVAAARSARPVTFGAAAVSAASRLPAAGDADSPDCPFCDGNEAMTPPEVARLGRGEAGTPGWQVRVFPNLYPIVGGADATPGTTGVHEVVALSPDHAKSFGRLDDLAAVDVVTVWRDRVRALLDVGHEHAFAIVNHLPGAGASIAHPHAQVFALDRVPDAVADALARVAASGRDLVATDAEAHAGTDSLLIRSDPVWIWCPHASTTPYRVRIAHPGAGAQFDGAPDDVAADTALALRDTLAGLAALLGDVPYNVVVRTAPRGDAPYHWYVDVIPRVAVVAGFEQATGILVNTAPPERVASELRDVVA